MLFHLERDNQNHIRNNADAGGACRSEHNPALHWSWRRGAADGRRLAV